MPKLCLVPVEPSTKEQVVLVAERLFAARGVDAVSLRQIAATVGNGNHSVVQYHFGSKASLVEAILEYRMSPICERQKFLRARHGPGDLRRSVESYVLPILEQGEQPGSNYLTFVAMLQQSVDRHLLDRTPEQYRAITDSFRRELDEMLQDIPQPLRSQRASLALAFTVHASADRERQLDSGTKVLPFGIYVANLLDALVGLLIAPASPETLDHLVTSI
jgi:AcrR family transcriptional regulator